MQTLNSKEKNKKIYNFIGLIILLCFVPVLIYSYFLFQIPAEISDSKIEQLQEFSMYENTRKTVCKNLTDINKNFRLLSDLNMNEIQKNEIINHLTEQKNRIKNDTSQISRQLVISFVQRHKELDKFEDTYKGWEIEQKKNIGLSNQLKEKNRQ
jgi:hypothetical protein